MTTTNHTTNENGTERTWEISKSEDSLPNLRAELIAKGFDGECYYGTSIPTGRQRKTFRAMFFRRNSGEFINALA